MKIDLSVGIAQAKKLQEMKAGRDNVAVQNALEEIREAAKGDANLMPPIIKAAKVYCTEGEINGVLREVFGEYTPIQTV